MERLWYLSINGASEGPYSVDELARDPRFNPDVLVRKEGMELWLLAGDVEELAEIFKDKEDSEEEEEHQEEPLGKGEGEGIIVSSYSSSNGPFWVIILLLLLIFLILTYLRAH
ncbi:MAG: DUF4339 domain-containing protein [Chlamydiota bacterium]